MPSAVILILAVFALPVRGQSAANRGRVMWSAFQCATFAEMSGDTVQQKRLFDLGYAAGQGWLSDLKDKKSSEAELREAPIGVRMLLGGPSIDFMIGRIFESAMNDAFDEVVKEDESGSPIFDPAKWASDEVKSIRARTKFRRSNCELLK
jgi:hypothetical protein